MIHRTSDDQIHESRRVRKLGRTILLIFAIAVPILTQGCLQMLDDDLGDEAGDGGGIVPAPAPLPGPMAADVRVIADPQGGSYVSELACTFEVAEVPGSGSKPILIQVRWVAPCGTHKSEVFVFDGGTQTFESTYSENGRTIAMTFWATISWEDARGQHQIQSGLASCS